MSASLTTTTATSPTARAFNPAALPEYAPIPRSALGPALNDKGYYVGRVERNLYWITDGVYQSAFLTTRDGVVVLDAPPTIGNMTSGPRANIPAARQIPVGRWMGVSVPPDWYGRRPPPPTRRAGSHPPRPPSHAPSLVRQVQLDVPNVLAVVVEHPTRPD